MYEPSGGFMPSAAAETELAPPPPPADDQGAAAGGFMPSAVAEAELAPPPPPADDQGAAAGPVAGAANFQPRGRVLSNRRDPETGEQLYEGERFVGDLEMEED